MNEASPPAAFDAELAHKKFSGVCFNRTWDLLDKTDRTARESDELLASTFASLWHWLQRSDATDLNLSIGFWQIARVYATLGDGPNAVAWGEKCLAVSEDQPPFYRAYAHEAIARGYGVLGDRARVEAHRDEAKKLAERAEDPGERSALESDLTSL